MMKNFGDLHNLRLLNFDSGDTRESKSFKREISKTSHYYTQNSKKNQKCSTSGLIGNYTKRVRTKSASETSFKKGSSRKSPISNIFKRQFNQFKRPKMKRTVSLYNLKQQFLPTSFLVTNPINKSLKAVTKKTLKRKQIKQGRCNNTDDHVIFMSETRKAARKIMKPNIYDDKRKLDWINNSKSSNGFNCKSNHYRGNKNFQSHKNDNKLFRSLNQDNQNVSKVKEYKENIRDPVRIIDRTLNLKSQLYGNTMPMSYNPVDFSCTACEIESQRPYDYCIHKISTIHSSRCLNKQVMVKPFCLDISAMSDNFSGNMLTPNNKHKINNTVHTENRNKRIKEKECCRRCLSKDHYVHRSSSSPLCSPNLTKDLESLAKLTLKYFLSVIAIIVWSPCILCVCIYWFIIFTARPQFFLQKRNISMFRNVGWGRNYCQLIFNFFAKISAKMYSSCFYRKNTCSMKKQKCQKSEHLKHRNSIVFIMNYRDTCPDPKNKYELSHSNHRGWIMKRLKKDRRFIHKRCECNIAKLSSLRVNIPKKVKCGQYCECSPEELKDKMKSKTIKPLSRKLSPKFHPKVSKVLSQKSLSNICDRQPAGISGKVASSTTPPDLISNKECHHEPFRKRSPCLCPENPVKDLQYPENPVKDLRLKRCCKFQEMSPRSDVECPFQNTLPKENVQFNSFNKTIKGKSPCSRQLIKLVASHRNSKRPIRIQKQNPICPKYTSTEICKTAFRPNIKPKFVNCEYKSKGRMLPNKQKVFSCYMSARKKEKFFNSDCNKDLLIHSLRTPCFWVYRCSPRFYPYFLIFYRFYKNLVIGLMFIISACIWIPILFFFYMCFSLFFRCLRCSK